MRIVAGDQGEAYSDTRRFDTGHQAEGHSDTRNNQGEAYSDSRHSGIHATGP